MKGTKNPINIFKTLHYRRKLRNTDQFCYNGLLVFMGGQGKRKNNYSS